MHFNNVLFLDLMGFGNMVNLNHSLALSLLTDYNDILEIYIGSKYFSTSKKNN